MRKNQKGMAHFFLLLIFAIVTFAFIGHYMLNNGELKLPTKQSNLTPAPSKKDLIYDKADWKTYSNSLFGISFMYPNDLTHSSFGDDYGTAGYTTFKRGEKEIFTLSTSKEYSEEGVGNYRGSKPISKVRIGNHDWNYYNFYHKDKLVETLQYNVIAYETVKDGALFLFQFKDQKELTGEQKQILSTFKFLDNTDDWRVFTSELLGFSFNYPPGWEYPETTPLSTRTQVKTNSLTITRGGYYNQNLGREITFNEYIETRMPTDKNIQDYTLAGVKGKMIIYKAVTGRYETLIAIPLSEVSESEILTVNYNIYPGDTQTSEIVDQILSTFKLLGKNQANLVKLYFFDPENDPNTDNCQANNFIEKPLPATNTPIKDTIKLLIDSGLLGNPSHFILLDIFLVDKVLYLKFPSIPSFTTGGSCHIGILTSQIIDTSLQFPEVEKVIFEPQVFEP